MKYIHFPLTEAEYLEALQRKGDKTHKEAYLKGIGINYEPPKLGRPPAFDPVAFEEKAMKIHLDRIRAYQEKHAEDIKNLKRARAHV